MVERRLIVSIIIVSWNTPGPLGDCLSSIRKEAEAIGAEIIVVDNASTDHTAEMVARDYPQVKLICNQTNMGFGAANNQGTRASSGAYTLFLNSDTIVPQGALTELLRFMDSRPRAAACGPRLAKSTGNAQPFAFGGDPTPGYLFARGWTRLLLYRPLHDWETRIVQTVDWVSGACLMARRQALDQMGGFDEGFFMYFEDNDLCLRLRRASWQVWYNPAVTITHLGGASVTQSARLSRWYDASLRHFYRKHYTPLARVALEIMLPFYRRLQNSESAHAHRD